ncbi:hypothetical protein C7B65_04740 [Phormidesmis priestleyi ULC007]|uniref:Uncharacterized protein n=1 Tax=Phormidesmis priestleyi ULC007 TaxID=1920490 RepID=A0A2T1DL64_9CYAN|nr:hypothetical protein [Phormidesmis priestleyi]PSB21240.1 hypothetical protein C7B65_04740 [Phormidesmis priestleyi ULC007]PZO51232.1 MAG: hypothetical protein DCF14_08965 [Phormidesmis priestleyi]
MTQPNFEAMTRKELKAYMLAHRSNDAAFYAYMDKVNAEPPTEIFPAPKSLDDFQNFPPIIRKIPSRSS